MIAQDRWTSFTLDIDLGNATMQTDHDIARALRETADRLDNGLVVGYVRDANGNSVGSWAVLVDERD